MLAFVMDFRSVFVLVCVALNIVILVLGAKVSILSQIDSEYRHALKEIVSDDPAIFFERDKVGDYQCFGPLYGSSEFYKLVTSYRKLRLFPRLGVLRVDNVDQEFLVIKNIFSFEEAQIVNKELSLMGFFYFASRVEGGYRVYIDVSDVESGSEKANEAKLQVFASMGRHVESVRIRRPKTMYLLILENGYRRSISHGGGNRCKVIARNEEFL